jgi:hypothetical protein
VITADQLFLHALGDYAIQSHWLAVEKTKRWWPAMIHAVSYTVPFLLITRSWRALFIIGATHAIIDRYRCARWAVWWRNSTLAPWGWKDLAFQHGQPFPDDTPDWLAGWLVIIADNIAHVLINACAIRWLG